MEAVFQSPSKGGARSWLTSKEKSDPVGGVAKRFLKIFQDHGVAITQIPQFIPQVTLEKLKSPESLIAVMTNEILDETAQLFRVKRTWLDGVDDQIYEPLFCSGTPKYFFEDLGSLNSRSNSFPVQDG